MRNCVRPQPGAAGRNWEGKTRRKAAAAAVALAHGSLRAAATRSNGCAGEAGAMPARQQGLRPPACSSKAGQCAGGAGGSAARKRRRERRRQWQRQRAAAARRPAARRRRRPPPPPSPADRDGSAGRAWTAPLNGYCRRCDGRARAAVAFLHAPALEHCAEDLRADLAAAAAARRLARRASVWMCDSQPRERQARQAVVELRPESARRALARRLRRAVQRRRSRHRETS